MYGLLSEVKLCDVVLVVYTDSQSTLHLSKNLVYHERTEHFEFEYHVIGDLIAKNRINMLKVDTSQNALVFCKKL